MRAPAGHDVVVYVEQLLEEVRSEASDAYDRAAALEELRGLLYSITAERGQPQLTVDEMLRAPSSEQERAHLRSLVDRALPEPESERPRNGNP